MSLDFRILLNHGTEELRTAALNELGAEEYEDSKWSIYVHPAQTGVECTSITHPRILQEVVRRFGIDFKYEIVVSISRLNLSAGYEIMRKLLNELRRHNYDFVAFYVDAEFLQNSNQHLEAIVPKEIQSESVKYYLMRLSQWVIENQDASPPLA